MFDNVYIKEIGIGDCNCELLSHFDRYQESHRNWHKQGEQWVLCDELFVEDWDDEKKKQIIKSLARCIDCGGCVLGVYDYNKLIGFASLKANRFGSNHQYLELNYLHVSNGFRGQGIGKCLFSEICEKARKKGAQKLYISANPAEDSIAFYRSVGCRHSCEINQTIQENEPYDCQLEYNLLLTE